MLARRAFLELDGGDIRAARAALEQSLELRRLQNDRRGVGLGQVDTVAGEFAEAERHLSEAREIFARAGDRWGLTGTLWRIADLAVARRNLDEAEAVLEEARAVLSATDRQRWIASTLGSLAQVALFRGNAPKARALLEEARERYALQRDARGVADVDEQLQSLAKAALSPRKGASDTTCRHPTAKGRRHD